MPGARRGRIRVVLQDAEGDVAASKSVRITSPGTTTAISTAVYSAAQGGTTVANPRDTDAEGVLIGYVPLPQRVDAYNVTDSATEVAGIPIYPDPDFFVDAFNDVGFHGAIGDGTTDDTVAIQAALDYIGSRGGGPVMLSANRQYRITSRLYFKYPNTWLKGPGPADDDYLLTTSPWLKIDFESMPAIVFGNGDAGSGSYCGIEDVTLLHDETPVVSAWGVALDDIGATILFDRVGGTGNQNGRAWVRRCRFIGSLDCVQVGTGDYPKGAGWVWIEDCQDMQFSQHGVVIKGGNYFTVKRNHGQSVPFRNGGAFVVCDGATASQPDGWWVEDNFIEGPSYGVWLKPRGLGSSSGSLANGVIAGNMFDRVGTAAIYLQPGGSGSADGKINRLSIERNKLNGLASTTNEWGVLIDQANDGSVWGVTVDGNEIRDFGGPAVYVVTPTAVGNIVDLTIDSNKVLDCTKVTPTQPAIQVGASTSNFKILRNVVSSDSATNKSTYAIGIGASCDEFVVGWNVGIDVTTACVSKGTIGNVSDKRYIQNIALVSGTSPDDLGIVAPMLVGPWHAGGLASGATDSAMVLATSNGTAGDSTSEVLMPFPGRFLAIAIQATANIAGATLTLKFSVNGVASSTADLTITAAEALSRKLVTVAAGEADSDHFAAGDRIGVMVTTPGGFTTNDITVFVTVGLEPG